MTIRLAACFPRRRGRLSYEEGNKKNDSAQDTRRTSSNRRNEQRQGFALIPVRKHPTGK